MSTTSRIVRASAPRMAKMLSSVDSVAQRPHVFGNLTAASSRNPFVQQYEAHPKQYQLSTPPEFSFKRGTIFKAPNPDTGLAMASAYARSLTQHGIVAIELGFDDPDSKFILSVVEAMGCWPDTHSASQGALWDVKYKPEGVKSAATGKSAHSISHSVGEFAWHTDAAFERNPTRFFGFHILRPDRKGGGVFRVLRSEDLIEKLSEKTVQTLVDHEYDLKVPDEFFKGQRTVRGKLLNIDQTTGKVYVRYRQDILMDPPSAEPKACKAVEELKTLLGDPEDESLGQAIPNYAFKENTVLLMDNARFLHSRTKIKDTKRWLRRVRFHGTPGGHKKFDIYFGKSKMRACRNCAGCRSQGKSQAEKHT